MKLSELKNKKILILGFAKEGKDAFRFLKKLFPRKRIVIADVKLSKDYLKKLGEYDIIIKSPGVPIHLPQVQKAYKQSKITSATEIFFSNCQGKIIGITGTKGKGAVSSLVYQILKEAGLKVCLVGNIGNPALSFLLSDKAEKIYVYELSSHQLFNLKHSPRIAVFLNIFPDHLDYFKNFTEYLSAKTNIVKYQKRGDWLIYNQRDVFVRKIAEKSKARKIPVGNYAKVLKNTGIKKLPSALQGPHNLFNIAAAVKVARIFKAPKAKIVRAVKNFKTRPHRLEHVGKLRGIDFYNDSASTIPESTIAAIEALGSKVQTIILGGSEKASKFHNLAKRILNSKIKNVILFPVTGQRIWQVIRRTKGKNLPKHFFAQSMAEAVKLAYERTQKNKICLLSPASASFSIFKNYQQRGDLFKKWVKKYAR